MRELNEEAEELKKNMDDTVKMAIVDYMNLVFGAGEET
jgi:replicative DNA helicase